MVLQLAEVGVSIVLQRKIAGRPHIQNTHGNV
jgi:hypothetical protein